MQILSIPCTYGGCYGNQFLLSINYHFGCMIASDTLFDTLFDYRPMAWVFGVKLFDEDIADFEL